MAAQPQRLTLEEFDRLYSDQKPYYGYQFGEAVQKNGGTFLHSALQTIVALTLRELVLLPLLELRFAVSQDFQPIPDVAGFLRPFKGDYPTEPCEVVIEILSPEDSMHRLLRKCRIYAEWGIPQIFILDPEDRAALRWRNGVGGFESVFSLDIEGRKPVPMTHIWSELDRYIKPTD